MVIFHKKYSMKLIFSNYNLHITTIQYCLLIPLKISMDNWHSECIAIGPS